MLGNLGYSSVNCESLLLGNILSMRCDIGKIGKILDYGVVTEDNSLDLLSVCMNTEDTLDCKPDHPDFIEMIQESIGKTSYNVDCENVRIYSKPDARPEQCFNTKNR